MKTCMKCGFKNEGADSQECPKCGAIYRKVERLQRERKEQIAFESRFNVLFDEGMTDAFPEEQFGAYETQSFERDNYPHVDYLYGFFLFLAAVVALVELMGGLLYFQTLASLGQISPYVQVTPQQKIFTGIVLSIGGLVPVAVLVSVAYILKMTKDAANHNHASKEFLRLLTARTAVQTTRR